MTVMDIVGPAIGAGVFVVVMSLVPEPTRRTLNAILVAGASGVYLSGGFGAWELLYPVMAMPVTFRALQSHRYIGIAWLMHAAWDLPHHLWGNPIWPFMRSSSFGCFVFDSLIAVWFLAGAPQLVTLRVAYLQRSVRVMASCDAELKPQPDRSTSGSILIDILAETLSNAPLPAVSFGLSGRWLRKDDCRADTRTNATDVDTADVVHGDGHRDGP